MKKIIALFILLAFANLSLPAAAKSIIVKDSTVIPLTVEETYTSKSVVDGQKLNAIIAEDVKINNTLVFKSGDKASLNVSEVKKAGFVGNAGELYLVNGKVYDVNGEPHSIDVQRKYTGEDKTYPKVLLAVSVFMLFPLALFGFVKGGQAKIVPGQIINVNLRNEFTFTD